MDKGFNDDELADIMNEIENLEQEFTEEVESKQEPVFEVQEHVEEQPEVVEEPEQNVETVVAEQQDDDSAEIDEAFAEEEIHEQPQAQAPEPSVAILKEVTQKPVQEVVATEKAHDDWKPSGVHSSSGAQTSMSFKVEGDMKLDLVFNISGKEVQLAVNENGLEIGLEGGAKFSVPLVESHQKKNAA